MCSSDLEGLSNNYVYSVLEDTLMNQSGLWIGTRFGLNFTCGDKLFQKYSEHNPCVVNDNERLFYAFGYADGFLGIGCNRSSILKGNDGDLFVGATDRLTIVHKDGLYLDSLPPVLQLKSLELFNEQIDWRAFEAEPIQIGRAHV